jgi:DNA polymerase III alpha subunit
MGLDQVKELTRQTIQRIIRYAPFTSIDDFLTRVDPRKQEAENLACVGGLEGLGNIPSILRRLKGGGWQQNQLSLFEWTDTGEEDWTLEQKVNAQMDILGVSLAAHPLELVADKLKGTGAISTLDAVTRVDRRVTVAGVQQASHRSLTTRGAMMLFLSVEDLQGTLDAILFPEVYRQAKGLISSSVPFLLTGMMEMDTERGEPFLRVEKVSPLS